MLNLLMILMFSLYFFSKSKYSFSLSKDSFFNFNISLFLSKRSGLIRLYSSMCDFAILLLCITLSSNLSFLTCKLSFLISKLLFWSHLLKHIKRSVAISKNIKNLFIIIVSLVSILIIFKLL